MTGGRHKDELTEDLTPYNRYVTELQPSRSRG